MMDAQTDPQVEAIDFRLTHAKAELDRIYSAQDELLARIQDELRQDFSTTRVERLKQLAAAERENYFLLSVWTF